MSACRRRRLSWFCLLAGEGDFPGSVCLQEKADIGEVFESLTDFPGSVRLQEKADIAEVFESLTAFPGSVCLQEKADIGEVMLSLCYLPTAGRLTLTVVKARGLKAMDITGNAGKGATCFFACLLVCLFSRVFVFLFAGLLIDSMCCVCNNDFEYFFTLGV